VKPLLLTENATTEFMREYEPDICKSVAAFANTDGGTIYVGVDDDGVITGVPEVNGVMTKAGNTIRYTIKPDITAFVEFGKNVAEEKSVIVITVQRGTSRPYFLSGMGIRPEGVFVRRGAMNAPATETEIVQMIKDADGEEYESVRSLRQELTFFEAEKEFAAQNVPFDAEQRIALGLARPDGIYTNLGLLMSDQCEHTLRLAAFEGVSGAVFKDRREFSGSLLQQFNEAYEFIESHNPDNAGDAAVRRQKKRYPPEAVREALLNALIHRDYAYGDGTLVNIFDDRVEFISIGGLAGGFAREDVMLGISITRNKNLANVFYRLTLVEAYGAGLRRILQSYGDNAAKPRIEATANAFKVTLPRIDESAGETRLRDGERAVMDLFGGRDSITRRDAEAALSVSQAMAGRVIRGLLTKRMLRAEGEGKNTRYVLI